MDVNSEEMIVIKKLVLTKNEAHELSTALRNFRIDHGYNDDHPLAELSEWIEELLQ